MPNSKKNINL